MKRTALSWLRSIGTRTGVRQTLSSLANPTIGKPRPRADAGRVPLFWFRSGRCDAHCLKMIAACLGALGPRLHARRRSEATIRRLPGRDPCLQFIQRMQKSELWVTADLGSIVRQCLPSSENVQFRKAGTRLPHSLFELAHMAAEGH